MTSLPDLAPLRLSLLVAGSATLLMLPFGLLFAWWLAHTRPTVWKVLIETILTLPLVLPPTVVGFYLLALLGRRTHIGEWINDSAGIHLLFTWQGAALAASVMALPLFIKTASAAFASVDNDLLEAGRTLGAGEGRLLRSVIIPISYRGLLAGLALAFARALGEFGATLMVAGNIPGRTQTLPLALYSAVLNGQDREALAYTVALSIVAFVLLAAVSGYQNLLTTGRGNNR